MPRSSASARSASSPCAPVEVRAGHDHRPLGVAQQRQRARSSVGAPAARAPRRRGALGVAARRASHEHVVEREVDERRARVRARPRRPAPRRPAPGSRRSSRPWRRTCVSGRTNGTWSISCSEPWPQRIAGARPPSTSIGEWFCCAEPIALIPLVTPGPGGQRRHAGLARDLRPALGGERGGRLVAHVDEVDALLAAAVVDREQVAAGEREQLGHAVGLQPPGDQPAAVQRACRLLVVMAPESTPRSGGSTPIRRAAHRRAGLGSRTWTNARSRDGVTSTRTSTCCSTSPTREEPSLGAPSHGRRRRPTRGAIERADPRRARHP